MKKEKVLYDSFNARYLSFEEIASTFIQNDQYDELFKLNHSLLMGPRGSGKTTLLKMLTPMCQFYYEKNEKVSPFFGVYIPTDIHWKRQIEHFQNEFKNDILFQEIISKQIVSANILISLCNTFSFLIESKETKAMEDLEREENLCSELIDEWKISKPTSSNISSLKQGLLRRIKEINSIVLKKRTSINAEVILPEYFYDDYFDLARMGCFLFKKHFHEDDDFKKYPFRWAFCFDELEIAPKWLQMDLLDKIRSTEQDILFKLTTSPLVSIVDKIKGLYKLEARQNEDYKIVRTWTFNEKESNKWAIFGNKLIKNKLERAFDHKIDLNQLFGFDSIDRNLVETFPIKEELLNSYSKGSITWQLFKESAILDSSFRSFLAHKNINYLNPVPLDRAQEDQIFRKIKPILAFRYQFRKIDGHKRSRKNAALYYGLPFIYQICDGNPRALIGLIDDFVSKGNKDENGSLTEFSIKKQSQIIKDVSEKYLNILETHPDSNIHYHGRYINLGKIIQIIGEYFQKRLLYDDFKMDPYGSFIVDKNVNKQILELLELAMHLGAIIYLDPDETITASGISGKKFRLAYLLHPYFNLPKREYNPINLSAILNKKGSSALDQKLLFDEENL